MKLHCSIQLLNGQPTGECGRQAVQVMITILTSRSSSARNSLSCFRGTKEMAAGGSASYVKGGFSVARSCVPTDTRLRCRHRFWCSFSCGWRHRGWYSPCIRKHC